MEKIQPLNDEQREKIREAGREFMRSQMAEGIVYIPTMVPHTYARQTDPSLAPIETSHPSYQGIMEIDYGSERTRECKVINAKERLARFRSNCETYGKENLVNKY